MSINAKRGIVARVAKEAGVDRDEVQKVFQRYVQVAQQRGARNPTADAQQDLIAFYGVEGIDALRPNTSPKLDVSKHLMDRGFLNGAVDETRNSMSDIPVEHSLASALASAVASAAQRDQQAGFKATAGMFGFTLRMAGEYMAEWGFSDDLINRLSRVTYRGMTIDERRDVEQVFAGKLNDTGRSAFFEFLKTAQHPVTDTALASYAKVIGQFIHDMYQLDAQVFRPSAILQLVDNLYDQPRMLKVAMLANDVVKDLTRTLPCRIRKVGPVSVQIDGTAAISRGYVTYPSVTVWQSVQLDAINGYPPEETELKTNGEITDAVAVNVAVTEPKPTYGKQPRGENARVYNATLEVRLAFPGLCYTGNGALLDFVRNYMVPQLFKLE